MEETDPAPNAPVVELSGPRPTIVPNTMRQTRCDRFKDFVQDTLPGQIISIAGTTLELTTSIADLIYKHTGARLISTLGYGLNDAFTLGCGVTSILLWARDKRKHGIPLCKDAGSRLRNLVCKTPGYALAVSATALGQAASIAELVSLAQGKDVGDSALNVASSSVNLAFAGAALGGWILQAGLNKCKARKKQTAAQAAADQDKESKAEAAA
jgi:hypothetical protein